MGLIGSLLFTRPRDVAGFAIASGMLGVHRWTLIIVLAMTVLAVPGAVARWDSPT